MSLSSAKPCETCQAEPAKYKCPGCEVKSCSLPCVQRHKQELECDGLRDRTKYVSRIRFTDLDFLSDYRLLEEMTRNMDNMVRENKSTKVRWIRPNSAKRKLGEELYLPPSMFRLQLAARRKPLRRCRLLFLPPNFEKRVQNTSKFDGKSKAIVWRIELHFPHVQTSIVLDNIHEKTRLHELLAPFVDPDVPLPPQFTNKKGKRGLKQGSSSGQNSNTFEGGDSRNENAARTEDDGGIREFDIYKAVGFGGVNILLKSEHPLPNVHYDDEGNLIATMQRYYELDVKKSIQGNLRDKTVVEYPTIFVTLKSHASYFPTEEFHVQPPRQLSLFGERNGSGLGSNDKSVADTNNDAGETSEDKFGLFDLPTNEGGDDDNIARLRRPEVQYRRSAKTRQSEESLAHLRRSHNKRWLRTRQEHKDQSFVHHFATQDEQPESSGPDNSSHGNSKHYDQYYEYYLQYYKSKYGIEDKVADDGNDNSEPNETSTSTKSDSASAPVALVGYDNSSGEES